MTKQYKAGILKKQFGRLEEVSEILQYFEWGCTQGGARIILDSTTYEKNVNINIQFPTHMNPNYRWHRDTVLREVVEEFLPTIMNRCVEIMKEKQKIEVENCYNEIDNFRECGDDQNVNDQTKVD